MAYTEQQENELLDYLLGLTRVYRDIEAVCTLFELARNRGDVEQHLARFRGILNKKATDLLDLSVQPLPAWDVVGHQKDAQTFLTISFTEEEMKTIIKWGALGESSDVFSYADEMRLLEWLGELYRSRKEAEDESDVQSQTV